MSIRPIILVAVFAAGVASAVWAPGVPALRKALGVAAEQRSQEAKVPPQAERQPVIRMDDERVALAKIEQAKVGPGSIAKRLLVPGTIAPDADRVAHVSVKLSGTVAELRKNIGDEV
jgi:cobalt-zinc-cadmium efflux system membrane fusion protein